VLALHQPAARDLRLITTALKVTTDLERIGDLAEHIAERAQELAVELPIKPTIDLPRMADLARGMLHRAWMPLCARTRSWRSRSPARTDTIRRSTSSSLRPDLVMADDPRTVSRAMRLLLRLEVISRRVGDHATNIAEMVIFMVKGRSIRHSRPAAAGSLAAAARH